MEPAKSNLENEDKSYFTLYFLAGIIVICMGIDIFVAWQRSHNLSEFGSFSCSMRPHLALVDWIVSPTLRAFVDKQCAQTIVVEPTFSIIFYMFKIYVTFIYTALYLLCVFLSANNYQIAKERMQKNFNDKNGVIETLKKASIGVFILLVGLYFCFTENAWLQNPTDYIIGKYYFKTRENFACLLIFMLLLFVTLTPYFTIEYLIKKTKK